MKASAIRRRTAKLGHAERSKGFRRVLNVPAAGLRHRRARFAVGLCAVAARAFGRAQADAPAKRVFYLAETSQSANILRSRKNCIWLVESTLTLNSLPVTVGSCGCAVQDPLTMELPQLVELSN